MSFQMIEIQSDEVEADLRESLIAETGNRMLSGQKLMKYVRALMGGTKSAKVTVGVNAVKASATLTLVSVVATNTCTVAGQLFTAVASGATAAQFNVGASDTLTADSLVAQINAHTTINPWVVASNVAGVVTITAISPGVLGNAIPLLGGTNITASAARLASGTSGSYSKTHYYGSAV